MLCDRLVVDLFNIHTGLAQTEEPWEDVLLLGASIGQSSISPATACIGVVNSLTSINEPHGRQFEESMGRSLDMLDA